VKEAGANPHIKAKANRMIKIGGRAAALPKDRVDRVIDLQVLASTTIGANARTVLRASSSISR
jgi:hypothetical protein